VIVGHLVASRRAANGLTCTGIDASCPSSAAWASCSTMIERFDEVDNEIRLAMAEESSPLKLGLCVLTLGQELMGVERMSADEIVDALDRLGIGVKEKSVVKSFNASEGKLRSTMEDGVTKYKVMTKGRQAVEHLLQIPGPQIVYVQSGEYRTARRRIADMFAELSGVIRICDPYYGVQTLDVLEMVPDTCEVRFLTGVASGTTSKISSAISYFRKQYPHVEMRVYAKPHHLHDRYLIEQDHFWLLGHGIKDIGNKESFIVRIKSDHVSDLISDLTATFDVRWSNSTAL
jgi:hypothetical protein